MAMESRQWWRDYFDADWLDLHEPLFGEASTRSEVAAMRELLGLPAGARILDAPCGWGRHTVLLPSAGFDAWGADLSPSLLRRAAHDHAEANLPARLAAADLRALPFDEGSFDGVLNVFTSLGLFLDDDQDIAALREVQRVLRPGGRFLLESMHRDDVVRSYASRDRWTLPDGTQVRVRRRFDPATGISRERLQWRRGQRRGEKRHALRLRTATEIGALVREAGFTNLVFYGDWGGEELRLRSPRVIVVAERGRA